MTTSTTPNQPTQRAPHTPSQRDFEFFRVAEIQGLTHAEIALGGPLSRRRISQIVENVRLWLSQNPCQDPRLATELERKRLAQHLERLRLEDVIQRARNELAYGKKELSTTTEKAGGAKTTTSREQPFNAQILKTYLKAIQALGKLNQEPEIPYPPPGEGEFPWAKVAMNEVLTRWYERIWSRKLKVEHFYEFGDELIGIFVKALRNQKLQAAGTQARSASEGNVPSVAAENSPTDSSVPDSNTIRRASPDPADASHVGRTSPDHIPSTASTLNLGPETMDCPSTASRTSQTSHREAPASQYMVTNTDAVTS